MHWAIPSLLAAALPAAATSTYDSCKLVNAKIPGRISYRGTQIYNSSLSSYYGGQERELSPNCIFRPTTTAEVAHFVKLMTSNKCQSKFAVRGGGHTFCAGAANIDPGITVDMRLMNHVELSKDKKIVRVGGGAIWDTVYEHLVPHNLTAMGGRIPGIGVGGFATGGMCNPHGSVSNKS